MTIPGKLPVEDFEGGVRCFFEERRLFEAILKNTLRVPLRDQAEVEEHWRAFQRWRVANELQTANEFAAARPTASADRPRVRKRGGE